MRRWDDLRVGHVQVMGVVVSMVVGAPLSDERSVLTDERGGPLLRLPLSYPCDRVNHPRTLWSCSWQLHNRQIPFRTILDLVPVAGSLR